MVKAMKQVALSEIKDDLSQYLRLAENEEIIITRHGTPAAVLAPVAGTDTRLSHQEIVKGMRSLRKRVKPGNMSVRQMVQEGRRY